MDAMRPDVNESVIAEWTDASGDSCTLGSLTPRHKRDAAFTVRVATDAHTRPGRVLMPKSTANRIAQASNTTTHVLNMLRSLSQARRFSVYMKPSDYA
ncbi:hypothetical protein BKCO1_1000526 [Neofusicoccum parvum]|nr:hypothetical protein BKCO1_1000526 [Neofusicoccum parvum]